MFDLLPTVSAFLGGGLLLLTGWTALVSRGEGEPRAAGRLALMGAPASALLLGPFFLPTAIGEPLAAALVVILALTSLLLLIPMPGRKPPSLGQPVPGVDERDIMFSRATLVPGTLRFEEYYRSRPEKREPDDKFRKEPGLLAPGTAHFHRFGFAAADAAFWTIERLRPFVEGHGGDLPPPVGTDFRLGGEAPAHGRQAPAIPPDPESVTVFLKEWTLKMGAHSVGVTELKDYHLYTHVGRGDDYGEPVQLHHTHALALTVEMDKEMVDRAPRGPTAMESALQYVRGGVMAVQLADLIKRLGFRARAHIDGNYRVICPLVARDAGLGELGRMGLIMTPRLGPRVRIAVVTTDLPLAPDPPYSDPTTIAFCMDCMKCASSCPSRAISFADPERDEDGVLRWRIDSEACFTLWTKLGTDCARCMAVCPYSHPDNGLHSVVRWGIRSNALFRKGALWMDDLVYGRRPPSKGELEWMG